ncbi:hypothetical protein HQ590_13815 [bacterium]|nr:hypothetical protein [bacterium]
MSLLTETPLIVPPGKGKGCLYRASGYGKLFAPMGEQVKIATMDEIRERINPMLSTRPYVKTILDQGSVGSCAAEMTAQAIMTTRVKAGQQHVVLNPWSIYATTSGGRDRGSSIDDNLRFAQKFGCLPEAVWPRSKGWREKPPQELFDRFGIHFRLQEVYDVGSTLETATALTEQFVVGFGWDGHSSMLDDLLDEDTGEYANSWDESFGDNGFGRIKLRSINYGYGAIAVRTTTVCPRHVLDEIEAYFQEHYAGAA